MKKENSIIISTNFPDIPDAKQKQLFKKKNISFEELSSSIVDIHLLTQSSAIRAINKLATLRNYLIGYYIVEYEQNGRDRANYGDKLLVELANRVSQKGLNETLFKICRSFYINYPQIKEYFVNKSATVSHQFEIAPQKLLDNLSFSHIREIMTVDDKLARYFYETECIKCCWSVRELRRQIATNLYFRVGLSKEPDILLQQSTEKTLSIKEPFMFEFLGLKAQNIHESDLEEALLNHLEQFLLELGRGFCFEARQKRLIIDDEYYYADLVFYNRILHCSVIIELKNDEFKHSDLSQLNSYVSYYRENEMQKGDNQPVGILLCTKKGKKMVEYALAGMDNNLFVSTYMLTLPDTKMLENFLIKETEENK